MEKIFLTTKVEIFIYLFYLFCYLREYFDKMKEKETLLSLFLMFNC